MRFSARAMKTLPRTWFMSVTVLSLPEREANSAASFSDSRRCCSSRAWWMQKEEWPFLRSMGQVRRSEVWRRHLLLLGSRESEFIWNLKRGRNLPHLTKSGRHRDTKSKEKNARQFVYGMLLRSAPDQAPESYSRMLPQEERPWQYNLRLPENAAFIDRTPSNFPL